MASPIQALVIHPLALLNLSDYYTRARTRDSLFIGALLGQKVEGTVVIEYAFEIKVKNGEIDLESLNIRLDLFRVVYQQQQFLGWFQIIPDGKELVLSREALKIHETIHDIFGNVTILLQVDGRFEATENSSIPYRAFQLFNERNGATQYTEIETIRLDANKAEWIASNDIVNDAETDTGAETKTRQSEIVNYISRLLNDVSIYQDKVQTYKAYIEQVKKGETSLNVQQLTEIIELLEASERASAELKQKSYIEDSDKREFFTLTETLTAVLTRGNAALSGT